MNFVPGNAPRRRSCWSLGCFGGLGVFGVGFMVLLGMLLTRGHYQPILDPPVPHPVVNGFDDYSAAGEMLEANGDTKVVEEEQKKLPPDKTESPALLVAQKRLVEKNQPALARLRRAFGKECRVPPLTSFSDAFPYLPKTRALARLLRAEAEVRAAAGDYIGAFTSGLDTVEMGQDMARGGGLIHGLVMIAENAIGASPMENALEKLDAASCQKMIVRYQKILGARPTFATILHSERNALLRSLLSLDKGRPVSILHATDERNDEERGILERLLGGVFGKLAFRWLRDDALREIEVYFAHGEQQADLPPCAQTPLPEPKNPICKILMPVFTEAGLRFARMDTINRIMLSALAIRQYRLEHGKLPATLADLPLDARFTADPYSGKPLLYKPEGTSYLLYSVGRDGRDDGGVPDNEAEKSPTGDLGIARFEYQTKEGNDLSRQKRSYYRRVPYMKPPFLPSNAPPLYP